MAVNVFICFNGNCREAVEFYADVFHTERPQVMTYGDLPPSPNPVAPMNDELKKLVMQASLVISGSTVMCQDVFPGFPWSLGKNINLTVSMDDADKIKSVFGRLREGGKVGMELQETFWSKLYGAVTDKFGIPWQFNLVNE